MIAIRLALLHVAGGTMLGGVLLAGKAVTLPPGLWALRPLHVEMLLFGFVVQLVVGVAFWILPRTPRRADPRPPALTLVLLNAGVGLVGLSFVAGSLAVAGRVCEGAGVAVFAVHLWPRVRAARESPGGGG